MDLASTQRLSMGDHALRPMRATPRAAAFKAPVVALPQRTVVTVTPVPMISVSPGAGIVHTSPSPLGLRAEATFTAMQRVHVEHALQTQPALLREASAP